MSVQALFKVSNIVDSSVGDNCYKQVNMQAVTNDDTANKSWSKFTPSGTMSIDITNPQAAEEFKPGMYVVLHMDVLTPEQYREMEE